MKKKKKKSLVKLCISLHFIVPLDPDPRTLMNPDPTGSGSTPLHFSGVVVDRFVGLIDDDRLSAFIEKLKE